MRTALSVSRAPYVGLVQPKVCDCKCDPKELFTSRTVENAVRTMTGYWSIYLTFYGDQTYWLEFIIVDVRDGRIVWKNGHLTKEESANGAGGEDAQRPPAGGQDAEWRWIVSGGRADQR